MTPVGRAVVVAAAQVALLLGVGGKLLYDRSRLPRAWVQTAGVDPVLPIRGRYVSLNLLFDAAPESERIPPGDDFATGRIVVRGDQARVVLSRSVAGAPSSGTLRFSRRDTRGGVKWMLVRPMAFFLPEHAPDPTRGVEPGELWMEVSVPGRSAPRPIRLRSGSP